MEKCCQTNENGARLCRTATTERGFHAQLRERTDRSLLFFISALPSLGCSSFQRSHHNPTTGYSASVLVGSARISGWDVLTQHLDLPTWPGPQRRRIATTSCGFHAVLLEQEDVSGVFLGFQPIRGSNHRPDPGYSQSVVVGHARVPESSWQDILVDCRRHLQKAPSLTSCSQVGVGTLASGSVPQSEECTIWNTSRRRGINTH